LVGTDSEKEKLKREKKRRKDGNRIRKMNESLGSHESNFRMFDAKGISEKRKKVTHKTWQ
jgi:hypothetical protein